MTEVSAPRTASAAKPSLSFEELVVAHWHWQRSDDLADEPAYRAKLAAFEDEFGEIIDSYWCASVPSAVALTEKPHRPISQDAFGFHRVSDWATKDEPAIAELLHKCDALTIKIARILRGPTREIAMRLVVSSSTHVLALVDRPAEHRSTEDKQRALEYEGKRLEQAESYYEEVGQRQAQLTYVIGMFAVTLVFAAGAIAVWATNGSSFTHDRNVLALAMGAAGALLSVMNRMSNPKQGFVLDYELGKVPLLVLGAFRPLLGAAFGLTVYAAIASGLVNLVLTGSPKGDTYFYALLSFAAGWSERLAKDILDSAELTVGDAIKAKETTAQERASGQGVPG